MEQHLRAECEMLMQRVQVSIPPCLLMSDTAELRQAARQRLMHALRLAHIDSS